MECIDNSSLFEYNHIDKFGLIKSGHYNLRKGFIMSKITIIGAGSVGATIANDLMIQGTASEIILIDVNKEKAFGEAMDIYQGATFGSPTIIRAGDYDDAEGSDIVIITSGIPRKPAKAAWTWPRPMWMYLSKSPPTLWPPLPMPSTSSCPIPLTI